MMIHWCHNLFNYYALRTVGSPDSNLRWRTYSNVMLNLKTIQIGRNVVLLLDEMKIRFTTSVVPMCVHQIEALNHSQWKRRRRRGVT
jgi:hypothetical protein